MTINDGPKGNQTGDNGFDTGRPITLLRDLEEPASAGFLGRLRRRIQRRQFASDVSGLVWYGPILVALELLSSLFSVFSSASPERTERSAPGDSKET